MKLRRRRTVPPAVSLDCRDGLHVACVICGCACHARLSGDPVRRVLALVAAVVDPRGRRR